MADQRNLPWPLKRPSELAGELTERINRFVDDCQRFALFERWRRMYCLSTGFDPDNDGLSWTPVISGKSGQIIRVRVNDILRYQRSHHVLVIGQRPSPQARPAAHDSRATEVVPVCNALLDNAIGKLGGVEALESANWFCQNWGSGWVSTTWDELAGREVPGGDEHEGDVRYEAHRPDCVVFDTTLDERTPHKWLMIAQQWDRYELAAEIERVQRAGYAAQAAEQAAMPQVAGPDGAAIKPADALTPDQEREITQMREHILGAASNTRLDLQRQITYRSQQLGNTSNDDTVYVYNFHYPPTSAVPEGRYAMLFGGKILKDGPSVYSELPVKEHCAMRIPGTRFGYTHMWDLMGLQQIEDAHITAATTTAENVGMSGVWIPSGSDGGEVCSMVDGCRVWKTNEAPVAVDFLGNSADKLMGSAEYVAGKMTTLSGMTETSMGGDSGASSGKQEALQYAVAVSNSSDYGTSYQRLCEGTFNLTLRMYRAFAETDRVVQIAGRGQELAAKTFTARDLDAIDGIDVENGAAILNSTAGVVEVADKLLAAGMLNRDEYLSLLANKRLDPVFDEAQRFEVHIERENEMLSRGEEPTVARTDNHPIEMKRHAAVINSPEARANPKIVEAVVRHLRWHDTEWMAISQQQPSLAMALGIAAHPMMMAPPPGAPPPGAPTPAGPNPGDQQQPPPGGAPAPSPAGPQDQAQRTIQTAGGPPAAGSPMGGASMPELPQSPVGVM